MKREILFRGKRTDNGEWIQGSYLKANIHWHERGIHEDWIATFTIQNGGWCNVAGKHAVIPETVGQYTGLTDKNGKKIFEGDIVKFDKSYIGKIVFNERTCGFECWFNVIVGGYGEMATCKKNLAQLSCIEVVGNIHESPELLERGCDNG